MALPASDRAVGAHKGKLGLGMIEAVDVYPGLNVMAGFTTERSPIGTLARHAVVEFTFVRILVASSAITIFEVIRNDLVGAPGGAEFVTVGTGNGSVSAGKREAGVAMFGNGVRGAMEILHGVARLAAVVVGIAGKLIVVRILVTVVTVFKFDLVDGVFASGNMALRAVHRNVFALERIF